MNEEEEKVNELLQRAEHFEAQGSLGKAIEILRQSLEYRKDPIVLTRIASLAIDLEVWNEAEDALMSAVRLDPGFTSAYFYLGLVYRAQDRLDSALACLEKVSREEPSSYSFTVLGVLQNELGLTAEAQHSFRRAISIDPSDVEALYNLATTLTNDDEEEAIRLFQEAIDINATYSLAHRELGWLLRRINQFPEAEYHLRRAAELDSSDGWTYIYLGNLKWAAGDLFSAEQAFKKAIEVWPDRSVPYWSFGYFRQLEGKEEEANSLFSKAVEIDPGDAQAHWRFGSYLTQIGDREAGKRYLQWAAELDPSDKRIEHALSALSDQPQ
jgi:tetratricopeptide (TPR) repeat protein